MQPELQLLLLLGLLTGSAWPRASPQNPLEQMAVGALAVGTGIVSSLQEGAVATQQLNFDTDLVAVHSKTAVGYGDAMRPDSGEDSDSSESDERRRRRRGTNGNNGTNATNLHYGNNSSMGLHRVKRAPCKLKQMMGATTEAVDDDDVEARRSRARKRAANNATRTRINKAKKKLVESRRRRRQAMQDAATQMQLGANLGERVKGFWLSFMDNVAAMVQQMGQRINGAATQVTGAN